MKEVKILLYGFTGKFMYQEVTWDEYAREWIIEPLESIGHTIKLCETKEEPCDIVIVTGPRTFDRSIFKGNPKIIMWEVEYRERVRVQKPIDGSYDYTISYYGDSETNLRIPLWMTDYWKQYEAYRHLSCRDLSAKTQFCTFMAQNATDGDLARMRLEVRDNLSKYKEVTGAGRLRNTIGNKPLSYRIEDVIKFHEPYRFNLCFENESSHQPTTLYMTEKLLNAYLYGTVPIYYGPAIVGDIFNTESFINCYGMTVEEIVEKVKEVDSNDELYAKYLNANPFLRDIDYGLFAKEAISQFIAKIIEKDIV